MTGNGMFTCVCGKRSYATKSEAKIAKRRLFAHDGAVRAYACDEGLVRVYHLGNQTAPRQFYRELRER